MKCKWSNSHPLWDRLSSHLVHPWEADVPWTEGYQLGSGQGLQEQTTRKKERLLQTAPI